MKKTVAIVLAVCVSVLLASCTMTDETVNDSQSSGVEGKKIGCVVCYEGDEWCQDLSDAIESCAESYGADITMYNAELDPEKQCSQIREMTDAGYDMLMIDPVTDDRVTEAIQEAVDSGVPVILYDESCPDVAEDVVTTVSWNQREPGRIIAEYLIDYVESNYDDTVNVLCVTTDFILNFSERYEGFTEVIENADTDIKIIGMLDTDLSRESAYEAVSSYGSDFDIVVGGMDVHAFGAIDAVEEAGKQDVKAFSIGGYGEETFTKLKEDNSMYIATVTVDPVILAEKMFDIAGRYFRGQSVEKYTELGNLPVVDRSNADDFITR